MDAELEADEGRDGEDVVDNHAKNSSLKSNVQVLLRQVLPHFALVLMCLLWAVVFAEIFRAIEHPHELAMRRNGSLDVRDAQLNAVHVLRAVAKESHSFKEFASIANRELDIYSDVLYEVFRQEFVRYGDIRRRSARHDDGEGERKGRRRHRRGRGRRTSSNGTSEMNDLWTAGSAIFFAATTMATIGYGNIAPVTSLGRAVCVVFALVGAPMTIITIGDLGKFVSTFTIWLYNKLKHARTSVISKYRWCARRARGIHSEEGSVVTDIVERIDDEEDDDMFLYNITDKMQVPVWLVFTLLLIYIAFGAILFSHIERWSYIDSFYFCFITLTTVGFGDLVPDNDTPLIGLMLLYIGVGLTVTTMCIDLVGTHYLDQIHYFGRQFHGTDLLSILRKRKAIERQMAKAGVRGRCDEQLMNMFIQQQFPSHEDVIHDKIDVEESEVKCLSSIDSLTPTLTVTSAAPSTPFSSDHSHRLWRHISQTTLTASLLYSPHLPSSSHTTIGSLASVNQRLLMYMNDRWLPRSPSFSGWPTDGSGGGVSPSTPESARVRCYANWRTYSPSVQSFVSMWAEAVSLGPSTPESYRELLYRQHCMRHEEDDDVMQFDEVDDVSSICSTSSSYRRAFYAAVRHDESPSTYSANTSTPYSEESSLRERSMLYERYGRQTVSPEDYEYSFEIEPWHFEERERRRLFSCPGNIDSTVEGPIGLICMETWPSFIAMMVESLLPFVPPRPATPPLLVVEMASSSDEDLDPPTLLSVCQSFANTSMSTSLESLIELPDTPEEEPIMYCQDAPVFSTDSKAKDTTEALQDVIGCPQRYLSKQTPTVVTDNYCFVVDGDVSGAINTSDAADDQCWKPTGKAIKYYYSTCLKKFYPVQIVKTKGKILSANMRRRKLGLMPPEFAKNKHRNIYIKLADVFQVSRFYSCWRSCPYFHRIVSLVEPLQSELERAVGFKRRCFVQYLWRGAKDADKRRVQFEYHIMISNVAAKNRKRRGTMTPGGSGINSMKSPRHQSVSVSAAMAAARRRRNFASSRKKSGSAGILGRAAALSVNNNNMHE